MNSSAYRFTLDLHSTQSQVSLPVTLGDTARVFYISLADGGLPYIIADGCLARLSIKRPTGTSLEAFCAIESNTTIKYDFEQNPNTAVVEGIHDCSVTLYNSEGREISSPRFTMIVDDKVVNKDDLDISDEDLSTLDAIIAAEAARQAAETSRVNAESARATAETNRAEAETNRVAAETARTKAEQEREKTIDNILTKIENLEFAGSSGTTVRMSEVTLYASNWVATVVDDVESDPYSQVVEISGATEDTKVDLLPSADQLAIFHDKDLAFVTENVDGVVTVYAIGDKPQNDYTIQVSLTEVIVNE